MFRLARNLERLAEERKPKRGRKIRVVLTGSRDDFAQLLLGELRRFPWNRAALRLQHAPCGIARELLSTLDERRVDAAAPEARVCRIGPETPVELLDADENAPHLRDRVDAEMRT